MMDDMRIFNYYSNTKAIVSKIKTLSKQKPIYVNNSEAINAFIEEDGLAALIAGLRKPYLRCARASKHKDLEEAYAFLCKFTSNEKTSNNMSGTKSKIGAMSKNFKF
jgi:hypothetical protein